MHFRFLSLTILIASLAHAANPGLIALYSSNDHRITTIVPGASFSLKDKESIHPSLPSQFTARYSGEVKIIQAGQYKFIGEARISVDSNDVTNKEIKLDEGDHSILIEFTRKPGPAHLLVQWQSDYFPLEPLPPNVLFHKDSPKEIDDQKQIERGRLLAQELNCIACHHAGSESMIARHAPDLSQVGSRVGQWWLYHWLKSPRDFRAGAAMPVLLSDDIDLTDVATFLTNCKDFRRFPEEDAPRADRIKAGTDLFNKVGCLACHDKDGVPLEGLGSKYTRGALTRYLLDPNRVDPSGRMPNMLLQRDEAAAITAHLMQSRNNDFERPIKEGDAKRGQQLVQSSGCLACHTLQIDRGRALANSFKPALELAKLNPKNGCLSENPKSPVPKFWLTKDQHAALAAFIESFDSHPDRSAAPVHAYYESLERFNCRACHSLDYTSSKQAFDITPPLTGVGYKLREEYLSGVLTNKQRSRPWIPHRMPDFGPSINALPNQIIAASAVARENESDAPLPSNDLVKQGRNMMGAGERGLGCVACHTFNGSTVTVLDPARGPEITGMSQRLRRDWFYRWVREPNRIQQGTAMPTLFFGKPEHEITPVIDSLWAYVSLGRAMQPPPGTDARPTNVLLPEDEPMLIRCVLHGGGQNNQHSKIIRAIAVGFPNLTSYVFDPQSCQLCYAWTGGFIDMTGGWSERGDSSGRRVGRPFYTTSTSPILIGNLENKPKLEFKAYALNKKIPEFIYLVDGVQVIERITPLEKGIGITRTFEMDSTDKPIYFVTDDDKSLTITSDRGPLQDSKSRKILKLDPAPKTRFSITIKPK